MQNTFVTYFWNVFYLWEKIDLSLSALLRMIKNDEIIIRIKRF